MHFNAGSCRSGPSRNRKRRRNRRRGRLDEVPNAAIGVNIDVPTSNPTENAAFRIVCAGDDADHGDDSNDNAQCSLPDPLCVNLKLDPDCPQDVAANTSAVVHRESCRLLCPGNVLEQEPEESSFLPFLSPPFVAPRDASFEPSVESDPLQLNDIKISLMRFESENDAQTPTSMVISQQATSVSENHVFREEPLELSATAQIKQSQRLGTLESDQESFACKKSSFKASTDIDLSEHLQLHPVDKSFRNANLLTSVSLVSSNLCAPFAPPRKSSISLGSTLGSENIEPETRPLSNFQNPSILASHLQTSARPSSPNSDMLAEFSLRRATEADEGQLISSTSTQQSHQGNVEEILILSDLPVHDVTSSQSADSDDPPAGSISDCSASTTHISSPPALHWLRQTAVVEGTRFYSLPHSQAQREESYLDPSLLHDRPVYVGKPGKVIPGTSQRPWQLAASSIRYPPESGHLVDSLEMTTEPPDTRQLAADHLIERPQPPHSQAIVTCRGFLQGTPTVLCQSADGVSERFKSPPLVFRTMPLDSSQQCGSSEQVFSHSPERSPPNICSSPLPSRQVLSTVPRQVSVIQQRSRTSPVDQHFPIQSFPTPNPSLCQPAFQSDGEFPNKAPGIEIAHPLDSSPNKFSEISGLKEAASSEPVHSNDSLRGGPSVQLPTSSLSSHSVPKKLQVIGVPNGLSKETDKVPRPSNSSLMLIASFVQTLPLNQVRSASTVQMHSSAQPKAFLTPVPANPPPLSISSQIDNLIAANTQILNRTSTADITRQCTVPSKAITTKNTQSCPPRKQSTQSASLCHDVNLNPSSRILFRGPLRSPVATPYVLSRGNASSGDVHHAESDCISLEKSATLSDCLQKSDENRATNITAPNMLQSEAESTGSTYDLRSTPQSKSLRTGTPLEKDSSSSDSDDMDDPEYIPPLRSESDNSDIPDDCNSVSSPFPKNMNPIPSALLITKATVITGGTKDFSVKQVVPSVSVEFSAIPPDTSGVKESSVSAASTFSEAHSLLLTNYAEGTCSVPVISQSANPTQSTSVIAPCESTGCISSELTGRRANSNSFEKLGASDANRVLENSFEPLLLKNLLRGSNNHAIGISTAATDVNVIPLNLEFSRTNSNCEVQISCRDTNENVFKSAEATDSTHTKKGPSKRPVQVAPLPIPTANATVQSQPKEKGTILEPVHSEKSSIRSNKAARIKNTPCTVVESIKSSQPDQLASSGENPENPKQIANTAINVVSDDSSSDIDDPDPVKPRRKRPSPGDSSSESDNSTMVDPDYVPPSRDKLPLKTPDSVLDAIPTYEHWIRNKFIQDESDDDTPKPDNACRVCLRKFPSHESLKQHRQKRYSDLKCCKCTFKASNEKTLKRHTNKHTRPKPYVCEECNQTFIKRGKYVKHFLMHRNDFYYICNICDQGFNEYTPYEQHVNKHLNKTPYKCLKCNLAFTAKALLQCHMKRMHKRNAYTQCTVCKKHIVKFWLADHMKGHEQKAAQVYLCEQCGKELKSRLSLSRHVLKHTGERPHMCNYCGDTFKVPGALKKHERRHTGERPYKCEVCEKTFAFNTPYRYHLRIHTGERPYTCEYCGMTFAQPSPYAVHKRLHTGERPYKCKICDDAFPSHAAVRNHMQTHANSGKAQKRTRMARDKAKPKKARKRTAASTVDDCSSGESEKELTVDVVQPRRSARRTKCTKSLVDVGETSSGENEE